MSKPNLRGFKYSPQTGMIYRTRGSGGTGKIGPCLSKDAKGYKIVKIDGVSYMQHRLCFQFMGVDIPDGYEVDHLNGVRHDNQWVNIRIVTPRENTQNRLDHRNGKSLYVHRNTSGDLMPWKVTRRCALTKRDVHYGVFKTEQDAIDYVKENFNV